MTAPNGHAGTNGRLPDAGDRFRYVLARAEVGLPVAPELLAALPEPFGAWARQAVGAAVSGSGRALEALLGALAAEVGTLDPNVEPDVAGAGHRQPEVGQQRPAERVLEAARLVLDNLPPGAPQRADFLAYQASYMGYEKRSDAGGGDTPVRVVFLTARQVAAMTPAALPWVVTGYLARGATLELDGKPKLAGKTTLEMFMLRAVLDGVPFLGQSTVRSGAVLLVEQTPAMLKEPLELAGLTERDDLEVVLWHSHLGVPFEEVLARCVARCIERGWYVLGIDTIGQWARIDGEGENQSGVALAKMEVVQAAASVGLACFIVRHDRKAGGEVGESGRGSNAWTGAADIVCQLARPEGTAPETCRVLSAVSRSRETPARVMINLTPRGYVVLGNVQNVIAAAAREAILLTLPGQDAGRDPERDGWDLTRLLSALPTDERGRTPSKSTVDRVLAELAAEQPGAPALVVRFPLPIKSHRTVYWLTPAGAAEQRRLRAVRAAAEGQP